MSEGAAEQHVIPEWTLGWRLQRALSYAGISVEQMAAELDVGRSTISSWINEHHKPKTIYLRAWAHRCRVPVDWLIYGDSGPESADPDIESAESVLRPSRKAEILARQKILHEAIPRNPERIKR